MTKNILQISGIVLFFFLVGSALTYPYELSYHGTDEIILLEDSYEKTSLKELINRNEFKGKVLYIRIWEPFDTEVKPYSAKELETFQSQLDSLKDNTDSDEYKLLTMKLEGQIVQGVSLDDQLSAIEMLLPKYKKNDVAFVYITDPDNKYQNRKDDFRKWKMAVKRYGTPGYHLVMNPELEKQVRMHFKETTNNGHCFTKCVSKNTEGLAIYSWTLFSNMTRNWFRTIPQFWIGIDHFLVASLKAKYTDFITA